MRTCNEVKCDRRLYGRASVRACGPSWVSVCQDGGSYVTVVTLFVVCQMQSLTYPPTLVSVSTRAGQALNRRGFFLFVCT